MHRLHNGFGSDLESLSHVWFEAFICSHVCFSLGYLLVPTGSGNESRGDMACA